MLSQFPVCCASIFLINFQRKEDNPKFNYFQDKMRYINNHGDSVPISSGSAVVWFSNLYNLNATYYYFRTVYYDEDTRKTNECTTTIKMATIELENFMSYRQVF